MLKGFEHVGICAKDTVALAQWYVDLFGMEIVYKNAKTPPTFFLKLPDGMMIEIYPASEDSAPESNLKQGVRHLALIPEDFDAACNKVLAAGCEIVTPRKDGDPSTMFFRDPEGNVLHFISRSGPVGL